MPDDVDVWARRALGTFGAVATGAGIGIVSPAVKEAVLSFLNHRYELKLFDAPPWMGWTLIGIGLVALLLSFIGQARLERMITFIFNGRGSTVGTFLTVKHTGFVPAVRDIKTAELPPVFSRRDLRHLPIDLGPDLALSPPAVEAALARQLRMPDQIVTMLGVDPTTDLGYCGIVQAPFQLLAGHQLMSWTHVRTFEWDRHVNRWTTLTSGPGPDLGVTTTTATLAVGADVAIAVEVSYAIADAEMLMSVPAIGRIVRVKVATPALDTVTHDGQVTAIARAFRDALDATRSISAGARVHVFCSAPMSVGFALGRMVSRTLHPPVRAYAYDRTAAKPYSWGIEINAASGAAMVVRN